MTLNMKDRINSSILVKKIIAITLFTFLSLSVSAQIEFNICIPTSWVGGGSAELTIENNSGNIIPAGSVLELNWPGILTINPWGGFTVSGSNPFLLTITNALQPGPNGPLNFGFTSSGGYFAPSTGVFNGTIVQAVSPPCFVPPSYSNFDCEVSLSTPCFIETETEGNSGEIQIGQGTVHTWNSILDVYIPENRKSWAIAMAVGHTMFTNLMGSDLISINEYFATAIQETNCGCDGGITDPAWVTNTYPNLEATTPVYCFDYTHGVAVGFFQEEYGTGWLELNQDLPCFIPSFDFDTVIVGKNFEAQMIGKVYHDYNNMMFLQYVKCFDVVEFMENCVDPYGPEKMVAAIYNRGMNAGFIENILVTNRIAAMSSPDLLNYIPGLGQQYAEQISRVTAVLDNNLGDVSALGVATYSVPWVGSHNHLNYYDELITWNDIDYYLNQLETMYAGVGVNMLAIINTIHSTFNGINGGNPISFRYQFGEVVDAIVMALPAFEPMVGLGAVYGSSGGNACSFPTANMEESMTICEGESADLQVFLTGTAPWSFSYEHDGVITDLNNISATPYTLTVSDSGLYYLTSVSDATGTDGHVICDSVVVTYVGSATASMEMTLGQGCTPDSIHVVLEGDGPWNISYMDPFMNITQIDSILTSPYYLTGPITIGEYILLTVAQGNCDVEVNDTISNITNNFIIDLGNDTTLCSSTSYLLDAQNSGSTYVWSDGSTNQTFTTTSSGEYWVEVDSAGCISTDTINIIIVDPVINLGNDTILCSSNLLILDALNSGSTYLWQDGSNNQTLTITGTGQYWVEINNEGCLISDTIDITILNPMLNLGNDTILCSSDSILLDAQNFGSTYQWNDGSTNQTFTTTSSGEYWVEVDSAGCISTDTINIIIVDPVINLGNDTIICSSNLLILDALNSGSTYLWQDGSNNQTLTITGTGQYWVEINNEGCLISDTIDITILNPMLNLGSDTILCSSDSILLDAQNFGSTYEWNDGSTNQTFTTMSSGEYWVEVDSAGCISTDTITVTIIELSVDLGSDTTFCSPTTFILDAQNIGVNYLWQDGSTEQTTVINEEGTFWVEVSLHECYANDTIVILFDEIFANLGNDTTLCEANFTVSAQNAGSDYLWQDGGTEQDYLITNIGLYSVEITNEHGCIATDSILVSEGTIDLNLGPDTVNCFATNISLDAQNFGSLYAWSDGSTAQLLDVSTSGTYYVDVTLGLCTATDTVEVIIETPEALFSANNSFGCTAQEVSFLDLTNQDLVITGWNWDFGDGSTSIVQNPFHTYYSSNEYTVNLEITTMNDCVADTSLTVIIDIYAAPEANFIFSPNDVFTLTPVEFQDLSINTETWNWNFGDGVTTTDQNPTHIFEHTGTYGITLTVTNHDCIDSIQTSITVFEDLLFFVPNAFTPDNDQLNQMFQPIFTSGFDPTDYHLMIFNRWGEIIFESYNTEIGWNGTLNSQNQVLDGVYIWKIVFGDINSDKKHTHQGIVTLLK